MHPLNDDIATVLITSEQLQSRIAELGRQITRDYAGKDPLLVGVLKGAIMFMVDLARQIDLPVEIDFMAVSSYGASTESLGVVRILKDLDRAIDGRHVLVVEDIVDTGLTLRYILDNLRGRCPASLRVCSLLRKQKARDVGPPIDYVGFEIPDRFVVGYGLDYAELYRNLPYVGVLRPEVYRAGSD
ncbi:MAG TPA: hypoxanthine phosphoribosyltransferase [Chloroflexota bacterium]|jgi:hypoxanthine phosphoribosyltransferase|nr:hypoxanthine phosphoribosyltransferase [Chloroflexota bacterium]